MANNQQLLLGEGAGGGIPNYIEEVFSTYLYASTSGTDNQVINGIDLSTKSGLVWSKSRTRASTNHYLIDTVRGSSSGNTNALVSNTTAAQSSGPYLDYLVFNSNGYTAKAVVGGGELGTNTYYGDLVSWTFREQRKFFDIVTYTGDGTSSQTINHNLGASPGCIITKRTDSTGNWTTWHRSFADTKTYIDLNTTAASVNLPSADAMTVSSTSFTVGTNQVFGNGSGFVYVAYIFAHDAGGFGLAGTDNVISCGSFTTDGAGAATVTLGYEPQWVMTKNSSGVSAWRMFDTMRGLTVAGQNDALLQAQSSAAEIINSDYCSPTATGFTIDGHSGSAAHIYIAIRRGPMKVPTAGTSVFSPVSQAGGGTVTTNFPVDLALNTKPSSAYSRYSIDRLRGSSQTTAPYLTTESTNAEVAGSGYGFGFDNNTGYKDNGFYGAIETPIYWNFRRAPSFFDEVCYTGTGTAGQTFSHNLATVPELMIVKCRSNASSSWRVLYQPTGIVGQLESTATVVTTNREFYFGDDTNYISPTSSVFTVASNSSVNTSARTYVAYLFATCAGVSKVGSYTGNGSSQTIACGFAAGSRFVMIKRTDSTGNWIVADTARGIIAGSDPALYLNSTAAEVTGVDWIDTDSTGFIVNQEATMNANVSSASYIFLAIS